MNLSNENVCGLAIQLERKFNPLTGYQDPYGCGVGGLKRLDIQSPNVVKITPLPASIFEQLDMYLLHTTVYRKSTPLLKKVNLSKCQSLLPLVDEMEKSLIDKDKKSFLEIINKGWRKKKESSPYVASDPRVKNLDDRLHSSPQILAHRLCGAGNGGFFLAFADKKWKAADNGMENISLPLNISKTGAQAAKV